MYFEYFFFYIPSHSRRFLRPDRNSGDERELAEAVTGDYVCHEADQWPASLI